MYDPKIFLVTGRVCGVELIFLRLICLPKCKICFPDEFGRQTPVVMQCVRSLKLPTATTATWVLWHLSWEFISLKMLSANSQLSTFGLPAHDRYAAAVSELGVCGHLHLQHHSGVEQTLRGVNKWTENAGAGDVYDYWNCHNEI